MPYLGRLNWKHLALAALAGSTILAGCGGPTGTAPRPSGSSSASSYIDTPEGRAELELALRLSTGRGVERNLPASAALFERIAETGDPLAQAMTGTYYFAGIGVEQKPETAAEWWKRAAAQNYAPAQADLAFLYVRGLGVPRDEARAMELARAAAARGNADGEDAVGLFYANGWGAAADGAEAVKWLTRAADQKNQTAMFHLGQVYRDGKGVAADPVLAYAWFSLSTSNARPGREQQAAVKSRDDLALVLLPDDLALGRRLAGEWKPGIDLASKRADLRGPDKAAAEAFAGPVSSGLTPSVAAAPASAPAAQRGAFPAAAKLLSYSYEVLPDGRETTTVHTEVEIRQEAAIKDWGQQPLGFSESTDTLDVVEAYTLKPDGRKIPVDLTKIQTQLVPGAPNMPMFNDQRQKVVIFPALETGDITVLTTKSTSKPAIPGNFTINLPFDLTFPQDDVRITITTPASLPLRTDTRDMKFEQRKAGDKLVYEWRYANSAPPAERNIALDARDIAPRLAASSFKSYEQLGGAYDALVEPTMAVTPRITELANEITRGADGKRKQAEALYNWVSRHIRYVAIEIGHGSMIPHDADTVLANGYGDCKDHSVLFAALLKAKGIQSNPVLINLGASYSLSSAPTISPFNHMITWLPDFGLYADTTAGVAPFGTLPFLEYGKPVLLVGPAAALRRTPVLPAGATSLSVKTTARLGADGSFVGDSETVATGPFSVAMRQDAVDIQAAGPEQAGKYQLRARGYDGTGRFDIGSPFDPAPTYRITGHFETLGRPELLSGNSFYLPRGLAVGSPPGDFLMGMLAFRDYQGAEPTPCFSGRETEEISLTLPEGKHLRELPKGTEIRNKYLVYKSEWSLAGSTLKLRREFSSTIDQPVCIGEARVIVARALNDIRKDYSTAVALAGN